MLKFSVLPQAKSFKKIRILSETASIFLTVLSEYWYNIMQMSHVIVHLTF